MEDNVLQQNFLEFFINLLCPMFIEIWVSICSKDIKYISCTHHVAALFQVLWWHQGFRSPEQAPTEKDSISLSCSQCEYPS